jgi:hypothetical protein
MTPEQRIAHLEADLAREREEKTRLLAIAESLTAPKGRSRGAERQAAYRERQRAASVTRDVSVTRNGDVTTPTPSSSPPPPFSLPPPSKPSPSFLYPSSPASSPPPPSASPAAAVAAPPGDELPDATEHVSEAPEDFTLTSPKAPSGPKQRAPSKAEALYRKFQELRLTRCAEVGIPAKDEEWKPSRINAALKEFTGFERGSKEANLFEDALGLYLEDDMPGTKDVPWGLGFFLASRATWEGRALKAAAAMAGGEA